MEGEPEGTAFAAECVQRSAGGVEMISGTGNGGIPQEPKFDWKNVSMYVQ